jgi:hypothetical protein
MSCGNGVVVVVVVVVFLVLDCLLASCKTLVVVTDSKRTITVLCDDGIGARVIMDSSWKKSNGGSSS